MDMTNRDFVPLRALMTSRGWTADEREAEIYTGYGDTRITIRALRTHRTVLIIRDIWADGFTTIDIADMSYGMMQSLALHAAMIADVASSARYARGAS